MSGGGFYNEKRLIAAALTMAMAAGMMTGCGGSGQTAENEADTFLGTAVRCCALCQESENGGVRADSYGICQTGECADRDDVSGSLDIMRLLGEEEIPYDAVWPASSLWLTVGDTEHRVKHAESISALTSSGAFSLAT